MPEPEYDNPGYPFFIPGVAGHRPPHPPLDFAWKEDAEHRQARSRHATARRSYLDGGLPRHLVLGGEIVTRVSTPAGTSPRTSSSTTTTPTSKADVAGELERASSCPRTGRPSRRRRWRPTRTRTHASLLPNGDAGQLHPQRPAAGHRAPLRRRRASTTTATPTCNTRRYKAAVIQIDVVLNKKGWHYPAAAVPHALGGRRATTVDGDRAPAALLLPRQHRRHDRVLAHQPRAQLLRARRLPGPHADRRHRPAHPPRQVRRDLLRRRRPTASTTRTAPSAPTRSATGSTRSTDRPGGTCYASSTRGRGFVDQTPRTRRSTVVPVKDAYPTAAASATRARPLRPAARRPGLGRRPDHHPALGHRPAAEQRRARPDPPHRLHARPLRPSTHQQVGPLRRPARRAAGLAVVPARRHAR